MKTIATLGPIGHIPFIPGTAGSLVGLGIAWILSVSPAYQLLGTLVALGLALWSSGPAARAMGKEDPSCIVIDEVAGMMVAVIALPVRWSVYIGGFLLFRFFDIVKPFPIRQVQRIPGSLGIVFDDLLAGVLVNLMVRIGFPLISW